MDIEKVKSELESVGFMLDNNIKKGYIKINDIYEMFSKPSYEVLGIRLSDLKTPSSKLLYGLYFKPFELYYSRYLDENMLNLLSTFIPQRYEEEKSCLDEKYKCGEIRKEEYYHEIEKLQCYFFFSSPYGINIGIKSFEDEEQLKRIL